MNFNPPGRQQTKKRQLTVALDDEILKLLEEAHEGARSNYVIERGAKKITSIKKAF